MDYDVYMWLHTNPVDLSKTRFTKIQKSLIFSRFRGSQIGRNNKTQLKKKLLYFDTFRTTEFYRQNENGIFDKI